MNNETVGISAEVAIANTFGVTIDPNYAKRADNRIVRYFTPYIYDVFKSYHIPKPVKHIAQGQNPIDFYLAGGATLSVKTNMDKIGRAAPQRIGQPTSNTYFEFIEIELGYDLQYELRCAGMQDTYENRVKLFKRISINRIDEMINIYWKNIFDCDYLILLYNVFEQSGGMYSQPAFKIFGRAAELPDWDCSQFSFTQTIDSWNESCTLKYYGVTLGNFQVHRKRNCFKFRFDMKGVLYLIENYYI